MTTDRFIDFFAILIIGVYTFCLLAIFLFSLTYLNMLRHYIRYQKNQKKPLPKLDKEQLPAVTVQLPLYNELYVVERLLHCIAQLDYPPEKLQIQVLDDSTDESLIVTQKLVVDLKKSGIPIEHIVRKDRVGFKAGALKEGLKTATGAYIAIFDADFLPDPSWLLKTIPHFNDPKVGLIQTRWGHLNRSDSILTQAQAFALDTHFTLEQVGRNLQNHFINFNGTAGVWRKSCIIDAGNWNGDTLTEDLDLSYRAQLKKWKFVYLEDVVTPAELPVVISAVRSQQFRWNKGGAENFQKSIRNVLKSKNISLSTKWNATMHLLNSSMFLAVFLVALLSVPLLFIKVQWPIFSIYLNLLGLFIISTLIFFSCYWVVHKKFYGGGMGSFFRYIPRFLFFYSIAIGLSFHNTIAILEGHWGKKTPFIRTPKFSEQTLKNWKKNKYLLKNFSAFTIAELLLTGYFLFGLIASVFLGEINLFGLFPFYLMLTFGFGYVSYQGLK